MAEQEKLIYKIGDREYLLMERIITSNMNPNWYEPRLKKLGIIEQGLKEVHAGGFLSNSHAIGKFLVPLENIKKFSKVMK